MAVQGPFKVEFGDVFPHGALVRRVAMKRDFNASTKGNQVQAMDKDSGLPLWVVTVIDRDPEAVVGEVRVNVPAAHQPVPPKAPEGVDFAAIEFEGLRVMPYVKEGRQAFSLRAEGMRAPGSDSVKSARREAA